MHQAVAQGILKLLAHLQAPLHGCELGGIHHLHAVTAALLGLTGCGVGLENRLADVPVHSGKVDHAR